MEHVGLTALEAERTKLLQEYDAAIDQGSDDPVKTEHGVSCEAHFRAFLEQFLPKKFGVTKGYIITPDLDYAGPLEEWDIIIYEVQEAPVLFVRRTRDENDRAGKRGIPVEFVRGVVEIKATFTKANADKLTNKLLKLKQFRKTKDSDPITDMYLPHLFRSFAVFFETKVANSKEYKESLGALAPVWLGDIAFSEGLIIRGHTCPDYSASISSLWAGKDSIHNALLSTCELSEPVPDENLGHDFHLAVVSGGFSRDQFWRFMIDMIHALNGQDCDAPPFWPTKLTGGYGSRTSGDDEHVRLFPE